eukprot:Polyplicarium_translucidae@DN2506_c0_g1_i2.p2
MYRAHACTVGSMQGTHPVPQLVKGQYYHRTDPAFQQNRIFSRCFEEVPTTLDELVRNPPDPSFMKIIHFSDTHDCHAGLTLPDADVVVHTGDWTIKGQRAQEFVNWYGGLPHKHKLLIGGNHDECLDPTTQ